jgi:uncharacterized membrane protein YhaH (DUF805 family)
MDFSSLLFSFQGRINRAKYWLAVLIFFVIGIVLGIVGLIIGHGTIYQVLSFVVDIGLFVCGLAVAAKRLHDHDKSAWWLLLFNVAPVVLIAIGVGLSIGSSSWTPATICGLAAAAVGIWAFVLLGCLRGTVGKNSYGPDPLALQA